MRTLKKFAKLYSNRFVSKWLVLAIDVVLITIAFAITYLLRFNFNLEAVDWLDFQVHFPYVIFINCIGFFVFGSFEGIIRHTSIKDAIRVSNSIVASALLLTLVSGITRVIDIKHFLYVPFSILIIHSLLNLFVLLSSRLLFKLAYFRILERTKDRKNVMIFGAGSGGLMTKNALMQDAVHNFRVVGFIDDNNSLNGKTIEGTKVYSLEEALTQDFISRKGVTELVISVASVSPSRRRKIINDCLRLDIGVKSVPPVTDWIGGELSAKQIRKVNIEDLLGRDSIKLDKEHIYSEIKGKTILITGAAGSIGSEIVRQAYHYKPSRILMVDQSETGLFEIENELKVLKSSGAEVVPVIADVSNEKRMNYVFNEYKVDMVFHAAAYKHVPMMEKNAWEAIQCNVKGSKNLADLSKKYRVKKFVMISTDKAVNPTNVMGASKRIAEMYVQSLNDCTGSEKCTKFITTRFGNVLGSNGSVIPVFKRQIESGGPLIVTHPDITRYFMTIPEACQLVLEAGIMGQGGEIFIFDMGQSVKIVDLAKKMIQLSGLTIGKDIEIKFSGLREGEKLYEELLNDEEKTIPTHHDKIMIAKDRQIGFEVISQEVDKLIVLSDNWDDMAVVEKMKHIVPEFKSNHSKYEVLDGGRPTQVLTAS